MKYMRDRRTGEVMPMNADALRHDDMMPVEIPDPAKMIQVKRGIAYLPEKYVFGSEAEAPEEPPAPKHKRGRPKRTEDAIDVQDSDPTVDDE